MPVQTIMSTTARALGHLGVEGRVLGATYGHGRAFVLVDIGPGRQVFVDACWHPDDLDATLASLCAELRRRLRVMPVASVPAPHGPSSAATATGTRIDRPDPARPR